VNAYEVWIQNTMDLVQENKPIEYKLTNLSLKMFYILHHIMNMSYCDTEP